MDLDTFTAETAPLTVTFAGGQELHLDYYVHALTLADALQEESSTVEQMVAQLSRSLARWDLTKGGQSVGTTPADLTALPTALLVPVLQAITEDLSRPEASGSTSSGTSNGTAS